MLNGELEFDEPAAPVTVTYHAPWRLKAQGIIDLEGGRPGRPVAPDRDHSESLRSEAAIPPYKTFAGPRLEGPEPQPSVLRSKLEIQAEKLNHRRYTAIT